MKNSLASRMLALAWMLLASLAFPQIGLGQVPESGLSNLSVRVSVLANDTFSAGLTVSGTVPRTVLIRAIGPSLAQFGVPSVNPRPRLMLFQGQTQIFGNDGWGVQNTPPGALFPASQQQIIDATARCGAFPIAVGSSDSVILITLVPGSYTFSAGGSRGEAGAIHVEIFLVPPQP